jgi:glycosyltransferase involved in cell wall biosynthesis
MDSKAGGPSSMDQPMQVTVVICTFNRAQSLRRTLESVVTQTLPQSSSWEILVVDNNSPDETCEVVEEFCRRYPERVRYAFEPMQGVSHARNTGVSQARGNVLAFIDDDETADVGWLHNLTAKLHSGDWVGAGGRIVPQWDGQPPDWLSCKSPFTSGPIAMFDHGAKAMQLTEPPFGANMAFRKEMFSTHGNFRTDLGRVGNAMLSGEDTEFGWRLIGAGEWLRYEPSAVTLHPVEKHRATKKYFLLWWFNKGRTDVRDSAALAKRKRALGVPLRLFRDAAIEALRWPFAGAPCPRFVCQLKLWTYAGQVFEYYRQSCDAKKKSPLRDSQVRP